MQEPALNSPPHLSRDFRTLGEMKNMDVIIKCGLKFDLNCFDSFLMGSNLRENENSRHAGR